MKTINKHTIGVFMNVFLCILIFFSSSIKADYLTPLPTDFYNDKKPKVKVETSKKKNNKKKYKDLIKDMTSITGFFDFYMNDEKVYLSIKPEQFNNEFLMGFTRQSGDGFQFDGSSMLGEGVFFFNQVGDKVQLTQKNTKFRADQSKPIYKSIANHIPNSIMATSKIISQPHPESKAILIEANKLFLFDFSNVIKRTNNKYQFDKENSYFSKIKSFPSNSEIDFFLHFKSKNPNFRFTLASSKSMIHRYHISISKIEKSKYIPRAEDDRIGYFSTIFQDYSNTLEDDPYVRYINRWNLKKRDPHKKLSKPVEPIVFWLENTIPHEFRDAVKRGILGWNKAFEKIGFIDAVVVKQMPDNADWDPADVRYNTIRWIVQPESAYAVGPSRANPYTGELYDADIRISNDYVRFYYDDYINFIDPLINENYQEIWKQNSDEFDSHNHEIDNHEHCHYGEFLKHKMAFTWNYLVSNNLIEENKEEMMKFVEDGIVDLLLHEVGHTLGLRHNFKASSVYSQEQLSDPDFTSKNGVTGSVMDYNATNLLDGGHNYFQTQPGPYDYWAIEYGYSEIPFNSKITEEEWLDDITQRSTDPMLVYGTDEDASSRSIDPLSSRRDMTSDPINFYHNQIEIANMFWDKILDNFEKDGERYPKIRSVFWSAMSEYYGALRNVPKFIGGIYHSRHHVGQETDSHPLKVVDVKDQRRALNLILNEILDKNAFSFTPELLNKMPPERYSDLMGNMWRMQRLDFPIHNVIKALQRNALARIHHPRVIHRIHDNVLRVEKNEDKMSIYELFNTISNEMWSELDKIEDINSFRRESQSLYIDMLSSIYFDKNKIFPGDTKAIAYSTLVKIRDKISISLPYYIFDNQTTSSHLQSIIKKIDSVLDAKTVRN